MITEKEIIKEIDELASLKDLVEVYGEVASVRMRKIRKAVLTNREFVGSIHDIFLDVLAGYVSKLSQENKQKLGKGQKVTFLSHNGKSVAVLLSANTGFYGDVVQNTFRKFMEDVKKFNYEATIIGKVGLNMFTAVDPNLPHTYFSLPDYEVDKVRLEEVIRHLVQYDEIHIYYGEYLSIVNLRPTSFTISSGTLMEKDAKRSESNFIFEPSVEKILMFFETEIFASLFDQTVRESQLAKFASRIFAMDKASQNIKESIKTTQLTRSKLVHKKMNQKQLNSLASALFY